MTELEVYRKLLKRLTGEDVEVYKADGRWVIKDTFGNYSADKVLSTAFLDYHDAFTTDILAYVNEPDSALDSNALALKRHYLELLEGDGHGV